MRAIQVKFLPDRKNSKARAKAWMHPNHQATIPWDSYVSAIVNFQNAVLKLLNRMRLKGTWLGAPLPNNNYAFICIDGETDLIVRTNQ